MIGVLIVRSVPNAASDWNNLTIGATIVKNAPNVAIPERTVISGRIVDAGCVANSGMNIMIGGAIAKNARFVVMSGTTATPCFLSKAVNTSVLPAVILKASISMEGVPAKNTTSSGIPMVKD